MREEYDNIDPYDEQATASYSLGRAIEAEKKQSLVNESEAVDTKQALTRERLIKFVASDRDKSRVLFVTNDEKVIEEDSNQHAFYLQLADSFDEVHILVTASLKKSKKIARRYSNNVWIYTTAHVGWYNIPFAVKRVAKDQLSFSQGFRPDFIVATDPYEAGLGAYMVAKKYERPLQIHVKEAFWTKEFVNQERTNGWRKTIAGWLMKRVESVRTLTTEINEHLKKHYDGIDDLRLLPRRYNIKGLIEEAETISVEGLLPEFKSVILFVDKLGHDSKFFRIIDATRDLLKQDTGLVIVGDGPAKEEGRERAKIFGVDKNLVFKPAASEIMPLVKRADVFICLDTDESSDEMVIKVATVGTAMILSKTPLREDLFTDGEEAFLCSADNTMCLTEAIQAIVSNEDLKKQFEQNSQYMVRERLHEEQEDHFASYVKTLEKVFNVYYENGRPVAGDEGLVDKGKQIVHEVKEVAEDIEEYLDEEVEELEPSVFTPRRLVYTKPKE